MGLLDVPAISRTQADKRYRPTVYDELAGKADGTPTVFDSGQPYSFGGAIGTGGIRQAIVSGGALTVVKPASGGWAAYPEADLTFDVNRIGAEFAFGTDGTTDGGTLCLVIWDSKLVTGVSTTGCHFTCTNTGWGFWTKTTTNGALSQIASGNFESKLASATRYRADVYLVNGQAMLFLPDGSLTVVSDPSIATALALGAKSPCWEPFATANTDARLLIYRLWADQVAPSIPPPGGGPSLAVLADAIRKIDARRTANMPAVSEYGSAGTYNVASSTTALDTTNLRVTFTAPPSGKVMLAFEGVLAMSLADTVLVGWQLNGPSIANGNQLATVASSAQVNGRIRAARKATLVPGGTYTADVAAFRVGTTGTVQVQTGNSAGVATMTVTPCT